ncbi:MAG: HAD-IB family hydrolase [Methyloprofundus sp.]|nr:HAD-IB family hydrolase [Methyloprofundus sp.]
MNLALFDFDGTITSKDSLVDFIQYAVGKPKYYSGLLVLSPILMAFKLKLIANDHAKQQLISYFFKNWQETEFQRIATEYSVQQIDKITRPKAMQKIAWHQQQGHDLVIVSASMQSWLNQWCEQQGITLISTQLEMQDGLVTGKFATKNCHGAEKVARIKAQYNLSEYREIYAYGDSSGDKEMLAIATQPHYRYFE